MQCVYRLCTGALMLVSYMTLALTSSRGALKEPKRASERCRATFVDQLTLRDHCRFEAPAAIRPPAQKMSAEATLCAQLPREAQKTLYSVLSRVALPSEADEKYRTLKLDNAALQQRLLRHNGALELLALCRFELRGRTLVLPADASADAIHRALDAMTTAAPPPATAPPPPPTPRNTTVTAGASPAELQARAEKRRRAAEADAAARALERRRWAADSAARRDRQAPAATPTRAAPTPPPPPASDQRRFRVRLPAAAGAPARAVAVAVAHDATLDALREAIAAAGVEGAFALVRSLPHRVFDAELPGAQSLAALGLDDGLTLVAMPVRHGVCA